MISIGKIQVNQKSRTVSIDGEFINLTLKEYELLLFLMRHKNQALSREQLFDNVWNGRAIVVVL